MTGTQTEIPIGTARLPRENTIWRAVQIRKPIEEVQAAWSAENLPGSAEFEIAPADRGVNLSVELDENPGDQVEHRLATFEGKNTTERLESALRAFKARLETGEVATTAGQPSGRRN